MAVFSTNQARHLYVAKTLASGSNLVPTSKVGEILPKADTSKSTLWFQFMSPGGLVASDKIDLSKVVSAKATKSTKMEKNLDRFKLTLSPEVNEGNPIGGQDYLLRLSFMQYVGISPEDQYWRYGMVHAVTGMSKSKFYKMLAKSLAVNLSRDDIELVTIYVHSAATTSKEGFDAQGFMKVTPQTTDNGASDKTNSYYNGTSIVDDIDSIEIEQVAQPWNLGTMPQTYIPFLVQPTTVISNGDALIWGTVEKVASVNKVTNGHEIADLEYFCMGERGDIKRNVGFPYVVKTTYLVDPTKSYDTLDITFYWNGDGEDVQKSQRTITIVADDTSANTLMKSIINKINSITNLQIADIE